MNLKEILKDDRSKWDVAIDELSDYLHDILDDKEYCDMCRKVYSVIAGGHYNKVFAEEQISKMYYSDKVEKHYAPYWTEEEIENIYRKNKALLPNEYNLYDFEVTLNMIKSDYHNIIDAWFGEEDNEDKYIELAANWLNDKDNPFGTEKVWKYFNSK